MKNDKRDIDDRIFLVSNEALIERTEKNVDKNESN